MLYHAHTILILQKSWYHRVKNMGSEKLAYYSISPSFLPIITISITFPMQTDFNSPKVFLPNFLQSSFAKVFYQPRFLLYGVIWYLIKLWFGYFHGISQLLRSSFVAHFWTSFTANTTCAELMQKMQQLYCVNST